MAKGEVRYRVTADSKPFVDAVGQASKEFDKFNKGVSESAGALGRVAEAAGPMGKALAVAAGAGATAMGVLAAAVTDAVVGLVKMGGHLSDLEAKTGISSQALQKLAYAGSLVGVSQDEITNAAVKMEKALANNDSVFERLGLSAAKLRAMQPDQAFAAIAAQIQKIKDPAGQAAAAMEAFGKGGASVMALLKSDIAGAGDEAERLGIVLSGNTVKAADALGDEATKLAAAWEGVKNQFAAAIVENPALLNGLRSIVDAMGQVAQWAIKNKDLIGSWVEKFVGVIQFAITGLKQLYQIGSQINDLILQVKGFGSSQGSTGPAVWTGSAVSSSARVIPAGGGIDFQGKAAAEAAEKARAARQKAMEEDRAAEDKFYQEMTQKGDAAYVALEKDIDHYVDKFIKDHTRAMDSFIGDLARGRAAEQAENDYAAQVEQQLAEQRRQRAEDEVAAIREIASTVAQLGPVWGTVGAGILTVLANLKDKTLQSASAFQKMAIAAQGAFQAYAAGQQAGSGGKGALAGAATGAAAGAAFGLVGAGVGAVVGGILGLFGGNSAHKKELADLNTQLQALMQQAHKAGIELHEAFNPKDAQSLKNAIADVQHQLDVNAQAQQALNDAIQRYGFTVEELGPAMAKQKLDEQAGQLYQDWQLLNAAGIDHAAIIQRMGPAVNDYVHQAVAAGQEIPEAMKPIIDAMIENGQLLDENGNAYKTAEDAGIHYSKSLSQMFEDLIAKVGELVDALNGMPSEKTTTVTVNKRTITEPGGGGGGENGDVPKFASGGTVTRTGLALVHAGEKITPAGKGPGSAGHTVNLSIGNITGGNTQEVLAEIEKRVERGTARGMVTALKRQMA